MSTVNKPKTGKYCELLPIVISLNCHG
jgi:hypothetical protein